ncbi:hypothetical protein F5Y19DRAFT_471809 [Xylariaceae sp. FL1651]|nr:hypothetical protein F5Y19DRAFT_471809 [Xylariaceae sp. FL1651]
MSSPVDNNASKLWDDIVVQLDGYTCIIKISVATYSQLDEDGQKYFKQQSSLIVGKVTGFYFDTTSNNRVYLANLEDLRNYFPVEHDPGRLLAALDPADSAQLDFDSGPNTTQQNTEAWVGYDQLQNMPVQQELMTYNMNTQAYPYNGMPNANQNMNVRQHIMPALPSTSASIGQSYVQGPANSLYSQNMPPTQHPDFKVQPPIRAPSYPSNTAVQSTAGSMRSGRSSAQKRKARGGSKLQGQPDLGKAPVREKQKEKVGRPQNAWILFRKAHQHEVMAQHPGIHNSVVSKILGKEWRAMSKEEKQPWIDRAAREAYEHKLKHPEYKYQPSTPKAKRGPAKRQRQPRKPTVQPAHNDQAPAGLGSYQNANHTGLVDNANHNGMYQRDPIPNGTSQHAIGPISVYQHYVPQNGTYQNDISQGNFGQIGSIHDGVGQAAPYQDGD